MLTVLALPELESLTAEQTRGAVCVWCTERLTGESAIDLGERADNGERRWPRACGRHVQREALRALHDHAPSCEQCVDDPDHCETGLGLRRLMRVGRR